MGYISNIYADSSEWGICFLVCFLVSVYIIHFHEWCLGEIPGVPRSDSKYQSSNYQYDVIHASSLFNFPHPSTFNFKLQFFSSLRVGWCPAPVGSIPPSISSASWPLSCRPEKHPSLSLLRIGWVPRNAPAPNVVAPYNHHVATFTF